MSLKKYKYYISVYFVISYFALNILSYIPTVSLIKYLLIIILDFCIIFSLGGFRKFSVNSTLSIYIYYQVYLIVMTIINGFSLSNCQSSLLLCVSLLLIKYIINDGGTIYFLKAIYNVNGILIPLNFALCIIFPNGLMQTINGTPIYLFGNRNTMGSSIILLIVLNLLYLDFENRKINKKTTFVIVCGLLSCIFTWSATSIICFALLLILFFMSNLKYINAIVKKMSVKYIFALGILLFFLIDVLQMQSIFAYLIESVFHKSMTLSARTYVWDTASSLFLQKPLFGYGFYDASILTNEYFTPANVHSFNWEILFSGGIIGFVFMLILILKFAKSLRFINYGDVVELFCIYYLIIIVSGITESTNLNIGLYIMMVLAESIDINNYFLGIQK